MPMPNFSPVIISKIAAAFGSRLRYPGECEALSIDIETVTGKTISVNTLKRMLGFIGGVVRPRLSTLDIIASYLGFGDWNVFLDSLCSEGEEKKEGNHFASEDLPGGTAVTFGYSPSSRLKVRKTPMGVFTVEESANSPLSVGEEISIAAFHEGYPIRVKKKVEGGFVEQTFVLGDLSGLEWIVVGE